MRTTTASAQRAIAQHSRLLRGEESTVSTWRSYRYEAAVVPSWSFEPKRPLNRFADPHARTDDHVVIRHGVAGVNGRRPSAGETGAVKAAIDIQRGAHLTGPIAQLGIALPKPSSRVTALTHQCMP